MSLRAHLTLSLLRHLWISFVGSRPDPTLSPLPGKSGQSLKALREKGGRGKDFQGKWHGQSGPHPQYQSRGALVLVMFAGLYLDGK